MTLPAPSVTLAPLPRGQLHRVAHIQLPAEKAKFSAPPIDVMQTATAREGHLIMADSQVVGFFAIDLDYCESHSFAPKHAIGLRMLSLDKTMQGKGIASGACRALKPYLAAQYPTHDSCYLTVNCKNHDAYRIYLKGGFVDTKELYLGGSLGPQHIMRLQLT